MIRAGRIHPGDFPCAGERFALTHDLFPPPLHTYPHQGFGDLVRYPTILRAKGNEARVLRILDDNGGALARATLHGLLESEVWKSVRSDSFGRTLTTLIHKKKVADALVEGVDGLKLVGDELA